MGLLPGLLRRLPRALGLALALATPVAILSAGPLGCSDDDPADDQGGTAGSGNAGTDGGIVRDGGGEVAQPPDGESLCPQGAVCNYQSGEGCGAGEACVPTLDATDQPIATCFPTTGTGESGDACTAQDQCAPGYMCAEKECRKLCCGGDWTGCPSAQEHCIQRLQLATGPDTSVDTGAMLCYRVNECDALAPSATCTKAGTTCQIVDPTGATACFPEGTGAEGEACPCKGGFLCADLGEEKICRKLCKAVEGGGDPSCAAGQACVHYNDKHPPNIGECVTLE